MKKRFILTEQQLNKYIEDKKSQKIVNDILEEMYKNSKNLNESISLEKANATILEKYERRNLLTPSVIKKLNEYKLMSKKL